MSSQNSQMMTRLQRFFFFVLSVCSIAIFATGGILLSQAKFGWSIIVFVVAIVLIGIGFMFRKRILKSQKWLNG